MFDFAAIWQSLVDVIVANAGVYWSPFILMGIKGAGICLAAAVVAWFFPVLRSVMGAVVVGTVLYLLGFRNGETSYKEFAEKVQVAREREAVRKAQRKTEGRWF